MDSYSSEVGKVSTLSREIMTRDVRHIEALTKEDFNDWQINPDVREIRIPHRTTIGFERVHGT